MKISRLHLVIILGFIVSNTVAQQMYVPTKENLEARSGFQDDKFGMFIHWGIYSLMADGEWVMHKKEISIDQYEKLAPTFNPYLFDPSAWVQLAKDAGMKYITITSKHHDGFAMYDSELTNWDIVDATPYEKDVIGMLAEECHKQGIKLFLYYSHLDWHHPEYFPRGRTGQHSGRPDSGDFDQYIDFMNGQLTELLTNYGKIDGIWFDGWWDLKEKVDWRLEETYSLIHDLQPAALIGNNHHQKPKSGEDFQMFERDLPGQNKSGHSKNSEIGKLPLETCETMNRSWGFKITDDRYKSSKELIHYLVRAAGSNANFLLNVGPMPTGEIQREFQDTLKVLGKWMETNGSSIYGTRSGVAGYRDWGTTTTKNNTTFVHVLVRTADQILVPLAKKPKMVSRFGTDEKVKYEQVRGGVVINLPMEINPIDHIIEITH